MRPLTLLLTAAVIALPASCAEATAPPPAAPPSFEQPALPAPRDIVEAGAMAIRATPSPDWAVAAAGSVWIAGVGPGLTRYDATSGAVTGESAVTQVCSAMGEGFASVWAMSCDFTSPKLVRIDARSGATTAQIAMPARLPAESSVGAGEGAIWVLSSGSPRQLLAIDPTRNAVARTFPAPEGAVAVRAGLGAVWVTVAAPGQVVRLDPGSGRVVATVDVGRSASFLALGPDAVWVLSSADGAVARVDPATNTLAATIKVSSRASPAGDIAAAAGSVWVRVTKDALAVRIDPRTNAVVDRFGPTSGSGGVAVADGSVWITGHDEQAVWRLPR